MKLTWKEQRRWFIALILLCMGVLLVGSVRYVAGLRASLTEQTAQELLTVTQQQQQALDTFLSGDRERLHSFARFFSRSEDISPAEIQRTLTMFEEVDAIYSVVCLDEGWFCSNISAAIRTLEPDQLPQYSVLEGSGVRDSYTGLFSGAPRFGYYESFTFSNGHRGLVQKSYDRRKVFNTFSLSFYNDQGFAYVINQQGDILLRPDEISDRFASDNIFSLLADIHGEKTEIESFRAALTARESGTMLFSSLAGGLVYTYVPLENVEGWYLVSVVPMDVIEAENESILNSSQSMTSMFAVIAAACAVLVMLMWNTHREITDKEQEAEYQGQLFSIFSAYLSRNTDDVYMMLDWGTRKMEYVSPNAERVLGLTISGIKADPRILETACPAPNRVDYETLRTMPVESKMEGMDTEWVCPSTGEHRWFRQNLYNVLVQGQRKLICYISDRTEERKAHDRLSEALRMAQAANEAKTAFLSNVSHDIRTPMNAIIGFLTLLRDEADNPDTVLEYTRRIETASQHLLELINDVLDLNKVESGSATMNLADLDMAEIIGEVNSIIRPQTKAKQQSFEIFASPFAFETLVGDRLRINQVLINLLSNAVKYTPEGGSIELHVEELPRVVEQYSRIRFTVADNGMGMSEEYQKVIFEPFTRENTEIIRQIQGTGLGMAITKSLVDLMGGSITVDSRVGGGSTFTVELELRIRETEKDPGFWRGFGIRRMIVADDDEDTCRSIVRAMDGTGVTVDYATTGADAVCRMRAEREAGNPYDLILLDWKMPDMDGLGTARLIRQDYSEKIPILLLTAYDWSDIEQEAAEIGVDHFLQKPFFMSSFRAAIRLIMGELKPDMARGDSAVKGKRILVVDDIEVNCIILVKILTTLGAQCDVARNGQQAVETFKASAPGMYDLIFMDVQMPVMDGYEATRCIRASGHPSAGQVMIIAMTANAFVDDVRDAIHSGMDAHIAKPIQIEKLESTIRELMDKRAGQNNMPPS